MIWEIMKEHETIKEVTILALEDAELFGFDVCSSINSEAQEDNDRHGRKTCIHQDIRPGRG